MEPVAVAWISFSSAVIGGLLVISGQVVHHWLARRADAEDKKTANNERITALVLDTVNWFEMDKQVLFAVIGSPVPPIQTKHPVYALVALIRIARPDLKEQAAALMTSSRKYFDLTRIYIPKGKPDEINKAVDKMANISNGIIVTLNTILEAVCASNDSKSE